MSTTTTASATATTPGSVVTSFASKPLTTSFSRPSDCSTALELLSGSIPILDLNPTCLPEGMQTSSDSYFSPGLACPSGYLKACHDNGGVSSVTTAVCCPTLNGDISLSCADMATNTGAWKTLYCGWMPPPGLTTTLSFTVSRNNGTTSTSVVAMTRPIALNAFGVRMVYQSTDVMTATATATADGSPRISVSSGVVPDSSSGLSTGAEIAIAIVIPLVALAVLLGAWLTWRRRRRRQPQGVQLQTSEPKAPAKTVLHPENLPEMEGTPVGEVAMLADTSRESK
ncbi:hypothetical protein DCS_03505 [Drechmeria coniospora]|uniref:Uncharacterized protein n=1 Tax=Drechmeria coniospora TaxID=98403 RepID=A0A151GHB1_DRECN|nr:hypothetical protein DCS_03505 [Drechmeria coniospora]KYK56505.1 hypothetical protein DCS_03505 [Drechmeria coniospora]ODA76948.1 hypothetical protein RJ55_07464 [Drechmeria coniospora]